MSLGHEDSVIDRISDGSIPNKPSRLEELEREKFNIIQENSRNYLNLILGQNSSLPVRVLSINLIGGGQFRESFLQRQLEPLLQNDKLSLKDFLRSIDETKDNFLKTQSITNMGVQIDNTYFKTLSPQNGIDLVSNVQIIPVKKYFLKIGTNVGNGEGDGYLTLQYKNIFGGAESLTLDTTIASNTLSAKNKSTYLLNFSLPVNNSPNWRLENIALQSSRLVDFMYHHEQITRGFNHKIISQFSSKWNHEFMLENVLRTVKLMGNNTSTFLINDDILFQSGDSSKRGLSYAIKYDSRDDQLLPTKGVYFKNTLEYSVLSSPSRFLKNQIEFQALNKFTSSNFWNLSFKSGYIHNMTPTIPIHVMDRFYLGGPNDLRGYELNGLGPKMLRSPIGGNVFYGANFSVFQDLGKYDSFKLQYFVNLGKLVNVKDARFDDLKNPSISTGVGLVYKHPIARFELNFVLPVVCSATDSTRKGLQYGIGLSFM